MTTELSIFKNVESAVSNEFTLEIAKAYDWKENVTDDEKLTQGSVLFEIDGLNRIGQRINEIMIPYVVKAIHLEIDKSIKGCKSVNQLLTGLGIPKGTASGYIKIANLCYDDFGNILPKFSKFNYKSLQLLAQATEENRERVLTELENNKKPTAKEVADALKPEPIDVEAKDVESKAEPKAEFKEESKAEPKQEEPKQEEPKQEEPKKPSNTHYQLTQLRAHIDSMTKEQIKKALDDIIALG